MIQTAAEYKEEPDSDISLARHPDISKVREMALKYNDLSPSKIIDWRKKAKRKAFMPEVSLSMDADCQSNVDLDRGSTNDPDVYIIGPAEENFEWGVSLEWDLSDAIFNSDIISLELRAKYLAELREDIMNRVVQLYYERERVINEIMFLSDCNDKEILDKQIRVKELEGYLDILTGGGFSRLLNSDM